MNQFISYPFLISRTSRAHSPQTFSHRLFCGRLAVRPTKKAEPGYCACPFVRPLFIRNLRQNVKHHCSHLKSITSSLECFAFTSHAHMKFLYVNCLMNPDQKSDADIPFPPGSCFLFNYLRPGIMMDNFQIPHSRSKGLEIPSRGGEIFFLTCST
jgi:hypothetical protein